MFHQLVLVCSTLSLFQVLVSFQTIDQGNMSGVDESRQLVIRSGEEWRRVWREHRPAAPTPTVDFETTAVIGIFLGSRPSAGYAVEITTVRDDGGLLVVEYREQRPPPGAAAAQVVTSPFHLVRVPRPGGDVRFRRVVAP